MPGISFAEVMPAGSLEPVTMTCYQIRTSRRRARHTTCIWQEYIHIQHAKRILLRMLQYAADPPPRDARGNKGMG